DVADIIDELAKESKSKGLRGKADKVVWRCDARRRHGDYPDATLDELDDLDYLPALKEEGCYEQIAAALKEKRPAKEEEAKRIVARMRLAHLYVEHGELPDLPDDSLNALRFVASSKQAGVLLALQNATKPISAEFVDDLIAANNEDD